MPSVARGRRVDWAAPQTGCRRGDRERRTLRELQSSTEWPALNALRGLQLGPSNCQGMIRIKLVGLVFAILVFGPMPGTAGPVTQAPCDDVGEMTTFANGRGVLENLFFDGGGGLWVTGGREVLRFAPDGSSKVMFSDLAGAGAMARGPGGDLFMGVAADPRDVTGGARPSAEVWRFNGADPAVHAVYASGLPAANGLAFDDDGNLYVSDDLSRGPVRVPAEDPAAWTVWGDVYSANGLIVHDGGLLAALTFDQSSPIVRLDLADPGAVSTVAELSFGTATLEPGFHAPGDPDLPLVPKGLDDMALAADGFLYVTANGAGELLRVDPADGSACVAADGLRNPSSVRQATGFGDWDGALFMTDFGGSITVVWP